MKQKKILCVLVVMMMVVLASPMAFAQEIETVPVSMQTDIDTIQPKTDIKEWRYAVFDGHLYRRLYNRSTGRWETDWILVE